MSHVTIAENADDASTSNEEPIAVGDVPPEASALGIDEDTSLVESIYLHLLGEHAHYDGLRLDEADATVLHDQLHAMGGHALAHPVEDLRFRPKVALANALYDQSENPSREVPHQVLPEHDDLPVSTEPADVSRDEDEPTDPPRT